MRQPAALFPIALALSAITPTWFRYAARSRQSLVGSARVGCAAARLAVGGAASSTDLAVASSAAASASIRDSGTAVAATE
jgi:hypothetical protein